MLRPSESRIRLVRRWVLPFVALGLLTFPLSLGTALAAAQTLYLKSTGVPISFLSETYPTATDLPNYDPARDSEPGLLLAKSSNPTNETDPTKYQLWMTAATGTELNGQLTFTFWSAMRDFDTTKKGSIRVQLLDCDLFLTDCNLIATEVKNANPWSGGSSDWVEHTIELGDVAYEVASGRALAVKIVVHDSSDDDMLVAYNTAAYPSSLMIGTGAPPTTTTSTTTTSPPPTTTTQPPPSTTTTSPPPTTTTTTTTTTQPPPTTTTTSSPTTTTTQPLYGTTTTTTLPPTIWPPPPTATTTTAVPVTTTTTASTTTIPPATTTTLPPPTTSSPPSEPRSPQGGEAEQVDIALAALPKPDDADRGGARPGGAFSTALIDGLALVIPPAVAAVLLSPLLLLEALAATFAGTGKELFVPLVILVVGVAWIGGARRRDPSPAFVPWYEEDNLD